MAGRGFLIGGIFDLSMSMATMLINIIQQGESRISASFRTNAIALIHWHSSLRLSG